MVTPAPDYEPASQNAVALATLIATRTAWVAELYDDIGKKKGVKKMARKYLAELLAYAQELNIRTQLRPTNPPS